MLRSSPRRLIQLPERGELLVCTDIHGNLRDFLRMQTLFEQALRQGREPFLLFTGDLIHGPSCTKEEWPDYLGSFFIDQSPEVVEGFIALQESHPSRVACLIGNHEHSHVGGPHTPKFWADETAHFEQSVGAKRTRRYCRLFRSLPVVAVARCGVAVTHAAPNATIDGRADIEGIEFEGLEDLPVTALEDMPLLGRLIWSRACAPETARHFLDALSEEGHPLRCVIYGHEIVAEGYERIGEEQLLVSTSFGVADEDKTYVRLDLSARYEGTQALREGQELCKLWG